MGRQYQFATVYITPAAQVENLPRGEYRIKFSLNFIDKIGNDTVIDIDILEVALKDSQGQIVNRYSSNMLNDDIKQLIEKSLISWLEEKLDRSIRGVGNFKIDTEFKI